MITRKGKREIYSLNIDCKFRKYYRQLHLYEFQIRAEARRIITIENQHFEDPRPNLRASGIFYIWSMQQIINNLTTLEE